MNSRFAFSLAARITFNNESSPRPRARVSTAPYTNESIPDARVVSLLFAPRARIAAVPRVPIASSDRGARASLSRVALARRPRRRRAFRETPHRRTASADVAVIARASSLVASFDARVGRVVRASRARRVVASSIASSSSRVVVCGRFRAPVGARDRGERFSSVYGILEFEFSPTRHVAARWRR